MENSMQLAPTLSAVTAESQKVESQKNEYKVLLQQLGDSDFVKEMNKLRSSIIG